MPLFSNCAQTASATGQLISFVAEAFDVNEVFAEHRDLISPSPSIVTRRDRFDAGIAKRFDKATRALSTLTDSFGVLLSSHCSIPLELTT
jgi:hypothetical protein